MTQEEFAEQMQSLARVAQERLSKASLDERFSQVPQPKLVELFEKYRTVLPLNAPHSPFELVALIFGFVGLVVVRTMKEMYFAALNERSSWPEVVEKCRAELGRLESEVRADMENARINSWQADFSIFDRTGRLAVIAEAKKRNGTDSRWATEWLQNYLRRQQGSPPPFVLLATPERLYLWKRPVETAGLEPTVMNARRLFSSYLRTQSLETTDISRPVFEFMVGTWLRDLALGLWQPSGPEERQAFVESGLLEAVEDGEVVADVAA